jgi:hypothetical protein
MVSGFFGTWVRDVALSGLAQLVTLELLAQADNCDDADKAHGSD